MGSARLDLAPSDPSDTGEIYLVQYDLLTIYRKYTAECTYICVCTCEKRGTGVGKQSSILFAAASPDTLSDTRKETLERLHSELVSTESERPDDTLTSTRIDTSSLQLVGPGVVWQCVQLQLSLQSDFLRQRGVSGNEFECSGRDFMLFKHLSFEVVSHNPRVHKR